MSPAAAPKSPAALCLATGKADAASEHGQGEGTRIYGKDGCPHTKRARAALPCARFVDVQADPAALEEMLRLTNGERRIPVLVWGEVVEIGFKRGS